MTIGILTAFPHFDLGTKVGKVFLVNLRELESQSSGYPKRGPLFVLAT